jgi:hypothetical protein
MHGPGSDYLFTANGAGGVFQAPQEWWANILSALALEFGGVACEHPLYFAEVGREVSQDEALEMSRVLACSFYVSSGDVFTREEILEIIAPNQTMADWAIRKKFKFMEFCRAGGFRIC